MLTIPRGPRFPKNVFSSLQLILIIYSEFSLYLVYDFFAYSVFRKDEFIMLVSSYQYWTENANGIRVTSPSIQSLAHRQNQSRHLYHCWLVFLTGKERQMIQELEKSAGLVLTEKKHSNWDVQLNFDKALSSRALLSRHTLSYFRMWPKSKCLPVEKEDFLSSLPSFPREK